MTTNDVVRTYTEDEFYNSINLGSKRPAIRISQHALKRYCQRVIPEFARNSFDVIRDLKPSHQIRYSVLKGKRVYTDGEGKHHILSEIVDQNGRIATILFVMDSEMTTVITCMRASICH